MAKAVWNGALLAKSGETVMVGGNHYFPPQSVNREHFADNAKTTVCSWKGTASYFDVAVSDQTNEAAAWYYPDPKERAVMIKDYVAFWNGVIVSD